MKENEPLIKFNFSKLENDFFSISLNEFITTYVHENLRQKFITSLRQLKFLPHLKTYDDSYFVTKLIRDWFTAIYVDDPIDSEWKDKEEIIRFIINKYNYAVSDLLIVGDNPK